MSPVVSTGTKRVTIDQYPCCVRAGTQAPGSSPVKARILCGAFTPLTSCCMQGSSSGGGGGEGVLMGETPRIFGRRAHGNPYS